MIRAIAIDDEPLALRVLENFSARLDNIELIKTFNQPSLALDFLETNAIDLVFLDIKMPGVSGMDLAKKMADKMVIFTTAYSQYAVEGFNLNAVDYLVKPIVFERFMQGVNKADKMSKTNFIDKTDQVSIIVSTNYSSQKIVLKNILFIESIDDYIQIHLSNTEKYLVRMTLKSFQQKLPINDFIRIHRSFIIPVNQLVNLRNQAVQIGQKAIPIGGSYKKEVLQKFNNLDI